MWTLQAFGDAGPESAAESAAKSPIADRDEVGEAIHVLEERFAELHQQGPSNYARRSLVRSSSASSRPPRKKRA